MKQKLALFISILMIFLLASCGNDSKSSFDDSKKNPPNLQGEWKQTNSKSDDSWQSASITEDTIEVYWISDNGETSSLYWAGTYVAPSNGDEPYSWDSENDHEKTDLAILASTDDTKTFTYKDGEISYSVSAIGSTTTVKLEKVSDKVTEKEEPDDSVSSNTEGEEPEYLYRAPDYSASDSETSEGGEKLYHGLYYKTTEGDESGEAETQSEPEAEPVTQPEPEPASGVQPAGPQPSPAAPEQSEPTESVPENEGEKAGDSDISKDSGGSGRGNADNFFTYDNEEQQQTGAKWVLNTNTMKIHYSNCDEVRKIAPQNFQPSNESESDLLAQGYTTCGKCH